MNAFPPNLLPPHRRPTLILLILLKLVILLPIIQPPDLRLALGLNLKFRRISFMMKPRHGNLRGGPSELRNDVLGLARRGLLLA